MPLEQGFSCPATGQTRRGGPLGRYREGFCKWLRDRGFSQETIRRHLGNVSHLSKHLGAQTSRSCRTIAAKDIEGFFQVYPSWCRNRGPLDKHLRSVRHSVNRYVQYLIERGVFTPSSPDAVFQAVLDSYLQWMSRYQQASPGTLELRSSYLTQFLHWLGPDATAEGLASLTSERIEQFFLAYAQSGMGRSARRSMQAALRTFLRFCLQQGYIRQPLDRAVPTLRTYKLDTVPRGLTDEQARRVLQSVHRDTPVDRRDYALLQLLYTYGVRGGQVRALRLEDIDWAQNRILFKASKHGKDVRLPLTIEVGESLLDYLQNSRPACSCAEVFVTCRAPYHPLPSSNALSAIVDRRLRAAGINIPSKGAHAFRHGFATRMLQQGHSLKAIGDILGHRQLRTTFHYTKVDFKALQQVTLPWPEEWSQ
jgi:integrase/recombinase XerD